MEDGLKEVLYSEYCQTCRHKDDPEDCDECNECLNTPMNEHSHKPIMYKPNPVDLYLKGNKKHESD